MFTNTYRPHVGGVANSVAAFAGELVDRGHRVMVVAPTFEDVSPGTVRGAEGETLVRLPAIQNFNGSDFSVRLPVPGAVSEAIERLDPDLVHSHHPFLLGDTALRVAASRDLPLVFTHHTMYERYTHYVPGDSPAMRRFVIRLATEYANLCDGVVAPSESVAEVLKDRGVEVPVRAIPTGIDPRRFATGDGERARRDHDVPADAFVVGHVGRLAPEKNLAFLARAVARFLAGHEDTHFLVVGGGPSEEQILATFEDSGLAGRLHMTGPLQGSDLADAYNAMDVFAFASQSETQGMVLAEAMTVGVPVVAVDATGAREVVDDGSNGRLLADEDEAEFAAALEWIAGLAAEQRQDLRDAARATAGELTLERCTDQLLSFYGEVSEPQPRSRDLDGNAWVQVLRRLETEWQLWKSRAEAAAETLGEELQA